MEKPIEILIEEAKQNICNAINEAALPHYIMLPILKELYEEYVLLSRQAAVNAKQKYDQALKAEKED